MEPRQILQLAHILVLGPLLLLIGFTNYIPLMVTAVLGAVITLYHGYKIFLTANTHRWVNLFHALVVGPTLLLEGTLPNPPRYIREFIGMYGFAAIGYHGYYFVSSMLS